MISIIICHLLNEENDRCLELNLKIIKENTTCPYDVTYIADYGNRDMVYRGQDFLIRNAKYNLVLWHSSDILLAPKWNENVIKHQEKAEWISLQLIECGQITVHPNNIEKDFGITSNAFRRKEFEDWVDEYSKSCPEYREGFCWYSPSVLKKDWYIKTGGFDLTKSAPYHVDSDFKDRVEKYTRFITVNGYAYHLQRGYINYGQKPERCCL